VKAVEELFEKHKAAAGFKDTSLYVYWQEINNSYASFMLVLG
jgi:hypothetical protein